MFHFDEEVLKEKAKNNKFKVFYCNDQGKKVKCNAPMFCNCRCDLFKSK